MYIVSIYNGIVSLATKGKSRALSAIDSAVIGAKLSAAGRHVDMRAMGKTYVISGYDKLENICKEYLP